MTTTMMTKGLLTNITLQCGCLDVIMAGRCWEETFIVCDTSVLSDIARYVFQLSGLNFIFMFVSIRRTNSTQSRIIVNQRIV